MTTAMAKAAILYNLRYAWKEKVSQFNDDKLIEIYEAFSLSDYYGNNDERFFEFIQDFYV